jgi:lipopolysaccharide heptosyltransferase I
LLIVRLSSLGDVVHTVPAVVALRRGFPEAKLTWVVEAQYREIVENCAPVDAVVVSRTRRWVSLLHSPAAWAASSRFLRELRQHGRGEVAIDFQGLMKSAAIARASGAAERFGFDRKAIREPLALAFLNRRVAIDPAMHVVDQNRALAVAAGAASIPADFSSFSALPGDPQGRFVEFRGAVLLHPGGGQARKLWPEERFVAIARMLLRKGARVALIWGPGERERAARIAAAAGASLVPDSNLRDLAALLAGARLVVSGDSGPLHLAAALGVPVVGLYGPTRVARNGPYGQLDHCVSAPENAMSGLTVAMVEEVIERVLG